MTGRSIQCGACGADVPYGRLSCPACGELLASVAGGRRHATTGGAADGEAKHPATSDLDSGARSDAASLPAPSWAPRAEASTGAASYLAEHDAPDDGPGTRDDRTQAPDASTFLRPAANDSVPGAYVPPGPPAATPAGPPALARAWGPLEQEVRRGAWPGTSPEPAQPAVSRMARLGVGRVRDASVWLAVAGAALSLAGFLLPWSTSVIGASGVGYFDRWGFAGPGHPLVALALLVMLTLGILVNPIPTWIRSGIAGLVLGALLFGLTWPYVFALSGGQAGSLAVMGGAALLLLAGVVAIATDRHAGQNRPV